MCRWGPARRQRLHAALLIATLHILYAFTEHAFWHKQQKCDFSKRFGDAEAVMGERFT